MAAWVVRNGAHGKTDRHLPFSLQRTDRAVKSRWVADRAKDLFLAATHPTVIVPFGMIPNSPTPAFPDGFGAKDQPYGVSPLSPTISPCANWAVDLEYAVTGV